MTRALFNTTFDLYKGPGSATPGVLVGTFDCRLVSNAAILLVGADAPSRLYYLTTEAATPVGVWAAPLLSLDSALADRIAVPSGTAPRFWCLFTEAIDWQGQTVYQRANLVELPGPHSAAIAMEDDGLVMLEDTFYALTE